AVTADSLNCVVYLLMKNAPEVGLVSNFWGALQTAFKCGRGFSREAFDLHGGKDQRPARDSLM
ncbi:hypothetical protein C8K61_108284, partial [Pseudomonas sp. GV071]